MLLHVKVYIFNLKKKEEKEVHQMVCASFAFYNKMWRISQKQKLFDT